MNLRPRNLRRRRSRSDNIDQVPRHSPRNIPERGGGHPNAIAYRSTADAFRSGDAATLSSLIAEDVVWHVPGSHPMAGDIRGRVALLEWLAQLPAKGFWLEEQDVFANDRHVCAISTMGARREDVDVRTTVVSVFRYHDRQQLERWIYPDDPTAWDAIFAESA